MITFSQDRPRDALAVNPPPPEPPLWLAMLVTLAAAWLVTMALWFLLIQ